MGPRALASTGLWATLLFLTTLLVLGEFRPGYHHLLPGVCELGPCGAPQAWAMLPSGVRGTASESMVSRAGSRRTKGFPRATHPAEAQGTDRVPSRRPIPWPTNDPGIPRWP